MHPAQKTIDDTRKKIHVHSVIYHHLGASVISDEEYDKLKTRLNELHENYPEFVAHGYMPEYFAGYSNMVLPPTRDMHDWAVDLVTGISQEGEGGTVP